jgi:transposase
VLTDTVGLLVCAVVHAANIQDRDGAPLLLAAIRNAFPWLQHVFADAAYAGEKLKQALARLGSWTIEIIKRSDAAKGFQLLPRRWVVERTGHVRQRGGNCGVAEVAACHAATVAIWVGRASISGV